VARCACAPKPHLSKRDVGALSPSGDKARDRLLRCWFSPAHSPRARGGNRVGSGRFLLQICGPGCALVV